MSVDHAALELEARERDEQYAREAASQPERTVEKETATRVYEIENRDTKVRRYVEAINPAQALRHVAKDVFGVRVPSALELARLGSITLEQAKAAE